MEERKAVIDIGTNSVKLCVAQGSEERWIVAHESLDVARLGEGMDDSGRLSDKAMERNAQTVARFVRQARGEGAETIFLVATMALRSAPNRNCFLARVEELTGLLPRILSSDDEARLSFEGAVLGLPLATGGPFILFDAGGGSTEFALGQAGRLIMSFSIDLGAVRITEAYLAAAPTKPAALSTARSVIKSELAAADFTGWRGPLVGAGGAVTTMAAVAARLPVHDYGDRAVQGSMLSLPQVRAQIANYAVRSISQRRLIPGLHPARADVVLAGACIVEAIMDRLDAATLTVSARGLRHGLLNRLFTDEPIRY